MKVNDFIDTYVATSDLASMTLGDSLTCPDTAERMRAKLIVLSHINLGIINLHRKFPLSTTTIPIKLFDALSVYQVKDVSSMLLMGVYNSKGEKLRFPSVVNNDDYDLKEIGRNNFLFVEHKDGETVFFVYTNVPEPVELDDELDVPMAMYEALLDFVCSRAVGSMAANLGADMATQRQQFYFQRFLGAVTELYNQGYNTADVPLAKNVDEWLT